MAKTFRKFMVAGLAVCVAALCGVFAAACSDKDKDKDESDATETCTVTFDRNGHGTAPAAQTVEKGQKATEPEIAESNGYTKENGWMVDGWYCLGWYKEAAGTNEFDFKTETINADTTVYAKWIDTNDVPTLSWNQSVHIYNSGHTGTINNETVYNTDDAHKWEYTNSFKNPPETTTYYYNEVKFTGAVKLMWHLDECEANQTYKLDIRVGDSFAQDANIRKTYLSWVSMPSAGQNATAQYNCWNRTFGLVGLQLEFSEEEVGAGKMCSVILLNPANEEVTLRIICAVGDAH